MPTALLRSIAPASHGASAAHHPVQWPQWLNHGAQCSRTLSMRIGPKGASKTHIGMLVGRHTNTHFISVEPIWLSLQPGEDGWTKVEQTIDAAC